MYKYRYVYMGPVLEFDHLLCNNWKGETIATSEGKAKSNLAYKFKKDNNRTANARIGLPGKLIKLEMVI